MTGLVSVHSERCSMTWISVFQIANELFFLRVGFKTIILSGDLKVCKLG